VKRSPLVGGLFHFRETEALDPLTAHHPPDNLLTRFQAQLANQNCKIRGQRMWLDLLVASGIGLPAMVYGSVLFLNYMQ